MKIAFYGSSLLSCYWNGAATYYRGLLKNLSALGHEIAFYEPDAFDRQNHRDIDPPDWARVVVYPATAEGLQSVLDEAGAADVVIKASGVGIFDHELLSGLLAAARKNALRLFWDVDAPATLAEIRGAPDHPLRRALPELDMVLTYGGGDPVVSGYKNLGARFCAPVYNALDPDTHFPVARDERFSCDLAFLGNRLPDREERVTKFFFTPAARLRAKKFLLGGAGWDDRAAPENVRKLGHVSTRDHNALNSTAATVLNISRENMATNGFSPATRVFEAAGADACIITDEWEGIELFLTPGDEILVARDGLDVAEILASLSPERAKTIGAAAGARIRTEHTYARRAKQVDALLRQAAEAQFQGFFA